MNKKEEKVLFRDENVVCPHCGALIDVRVIRETITPTVKGEYNRRIEANKNPQTKLAVESDE